MRIHHYTEKDELKESLVDNLSDAVIEELGLGRKVIIFLSGGSAMDLYPSLLEKLSSQVEDFSKLIFAIGDDRFSSEKKNLPKDEFNSRKLSEIFSKYPDLQVKFFSDSDLAAENFENYEKFIDEVFLGAGVTKMAVLGIGNDQHISGVKPAEELGMSSDDYLRMFYGEQYLAKYDAVDFPIRVTLTLSALKQLDRVFVNLVEKPDIADQLENMGADSFDQNELAVSPMHILLAMPGNSVDIFVA